MEMLPQPSLQQITENIAPNSTITITSIINDYIIFDIGLNIGRNKKKQYKIKC